MKKKIIPYLLIFTIFFNLSTQIVKAETPAAAIPIVIETYEILTFVGTILTYMGVQFVNEQERQQWIESEYGVGSTGYQSVSDILKDAKIQFSNQEPNYNPKPKPKMIAIPVSDSFIDKIIQLLDNTTIENPLVGIEETSMYNYISNKHPGKKYRLLTMTNSSQPNWTTGLFYVYLVSATFDDCDITYFSDEYGLKTKIKKRNGLTFNRYFAYATENSNFGYQTNNSVDFYNSTYSGEGTFGILNVSSKPFTLPNGSYNKSWTSPYTGMQTVTIPLNPPWIENPITPPFEIPYSPDEEVAPDEVVVPLPQPENDPLINPETGLPFIDPETGLPIFPNNPLVPETPIVPIPLPETLTEPKDYTPKLIEIINSIKQIPEKIINPIKKLFIPDKVDNIDFSPLNVPILKKFPFCIPFDISNLFTNLSAESKVPHWEINLNFFGNTYPIIIDFTEFSIIAEIVRFFTLITFVIGLMLVTRNLIRG